MTQKWVFAFEEGDGKNKMLLGGKGANLCEMTQIGLNVPPGFTHLAKDAQAASNSGRFSVIDSAQKNIVAASHRRSGRSKIDLCANSHFACNRGPGSAGSCFFPW